tara:strand:+ start:206 stop:451 length:246 start_codon:yes stop_codon:yes gene_type:complete
MIDNNLFFSFVIAIVNTIAFYFLKNTEDEYDIDKRNQELCMLFGITFATSFSLRLLMSSDLMKGGSETIHNTFEHSSRAPF